MNDKAELIERLRIDSAEHDDSLSVGGRIAWSMLAILTVGALAFAGWKLWQRNQLPVVGVLTVASVEIEASRGRQSVLDASGYVVARRQATVSSEVTGKLSEVLVEEGMRVEEGQVLARLDPTTEQAQLELAAAQLAATRSALAELGVQLDDAERTQRRQSELQARGLTSQAAVDEADASVAALRARIDARESDVVVSERSVALRRQLLDELTIRAPFTGVVIAKAAQPGEMVSPVSAGGGFTRTGICTIVDMASLEIEVDVNEAYIQRVEDGQQAIARLDAYPDWAIPAQVIAVVPTADRQKATVRVRVGFLESDGRILPDMGVSVRFLDEEGGAQPSEAAVVRAVEIPIDAVARQNGRSYVFVLEGEQVERRAIQLGEQRRDRVIVAAGLRDGELIVDDLTGLELTDQQTVRTTENPA